MVPDTRFLLELNPTQTHSIIMVVNLWVAATTNKSTVTTQKNAPLSMKPIQIPMVPIKQNEKLDHYQVGT